MAASMIIGIDVGGTNTSGGLASEDGALVAKTRRQTDRIAGASAGLRLITEMIMEFVEHAGRHGSEVRRIGVGFGGPVDFERGVVLLSHHVPGWENVPLRDRLERQFQVPVTVDNDANTGTLGEWKFGAGRGFNDLFYINIGTGIGGGIIAHGRPLRGAQNLAGEIGHTIVVRNGPLCSCGKRGCLESCASGDAIARRGSEALGRHVSGKEIFALALDHNLVAQGVLNEVIKDLAHGIGTAVSLLNPAVVIVGGELSESPQHLFLSPLKGAISRFCLSEAAANLRIEAAQLGYEAGIMGAVALALS